jgi:hypothetical protein
MRLTSRAFSDEANRGKEPAKLAPAFGKQGWYHLVNEKKGNGLRDAS